VTACVRALQLRREKTKVLNLLITGSGSFVGNAVRAHLAGNPDFSVTMLSVRGDEWRDHDFSRYDAVLHAAGIAHVMTDDSMDAEYDAVNHRLTAEIARAAKNAGVKQFVFLSSMIVYGAAAPVGRRRTITADTVPAPVNAYGKSKLDAENALRALEDESFRVAVLRPPMIYGPGCRGNYNTLVKLARKLPVFPEFVNRRSMLYVENLAELARLILMNGDRGVFHPQDEAPRSVSEIVREVCAAHGRRMPMLRALAPMVRLAGGVGMVRRAFGDMVYDPAMSEYSENYRIVGFSEAIRRTEEANPWN